MSELYDRITRYIDMRIAAEGKDVFTSKEVQKLRVAEYELEHCLNEVERKLENLS